MKHQDPSTGAVLAVGARHGRRAWQRLAQRNGLVGIGDWALTRLLNGPSDPQYVDAIKVAMRSGYVRGWDGYRWEPVQHDGAIWLIRSDDTGGMQ